MGEKRTRHVPSAERKNKISISDPSATMGVYRHPFILLIVDYVRISGGADQTDLRAARLRWRFFEHQDSSALSMAAIPSKGLSIRSRSTSLPGKGGLK